MAPRRPENTTYDALVDARFAREELWPEPETTIFYRTLVRGAERIVFQTLGHKEPELARECATKTLLRLHEFNEHSTFSTWFYRLVRNTVLDYVRHEGRLREIQLDCVEEGRLAIGPPELPASLPDGLSLTDRYLLSWMLKGADQSEIAKRLGIHQSSVSKRWKKLREQLQEFYGNQ